MDILLITDSYPPEIRSASNLMQELAEGLRDRGHAVTVATSYPQYNLAETSNRTFNELSVENGIGVIRIRTLPHHKVNFFIRGIAQLSLPYIFLRKIMRYITKQIDVVIVYSPPLPLVHTGAAIKKMMNAKFILNVQDIFPQNAVDLGILRGRPLIRFFEGMERKAYETADRIIVHSEGNADLLRSRRNFPGEKIFILHNWIDLTEYAGSAKTDRFRKQYGLANRFVILFAGVLGPSQGLDFILDVADRLRGQTEICFLLVGDGMEKKNLIAIADKKGLTNVFFKPFVSREQYPELVKEADVGLVCLSARNKTPVVPGKILGYMAASIPIVAFLNAESDGHRIIRNAQCGFTAVSNDPDSASRTIMKIYSERDRLPKLGKNGLDYLQRNFERNICIDKLEDLFKQNAKGEKAHES